MPHPFGLEVVFSELFGQGVVHVFDEHFPKMMEGYMQLPTHLNLASLTYCLGRYS
jgi:hypothetical protein